MILAPNRYGFAVFRAWFEAPRPNSRYSTGVECRSLQIDHLMSWCPLIRSNYK